MRSEVNKIRTVDDFTSLLSEISSSQREKIIVFRGQVSDRPLVASFFRGTPSRRRAPGCHPYLTISWSDYLSRLLSQPDSKIEGDPPYHVSSALMQHYGYRSFFIDVTEDPWIALWFALNKFVRKTVPIFVEDHKLRSAKLTWVHYKNVSNGFVYVLGIKEDLIMQRYIPLTKLLPSSATRVFRQKAGAIACDRKTKGAEDLILCKMHISHPNKELIAKVRKYTMNFLFPPPNEDACYKRLCTIPFYVPISRETTDISIQLAEQILPIPFFASDIRELVKNYKPLVSILSGERVAFEWNVANATTIVDGNQYSASQARRILVQGLLATSLKKTITEAYPINFDVWPSNNFLIEFDLDVAFIEPLGEPINSLLRALWVVKGRNTFCISKIVDLLSNVKVEEGKIYSLRLAGKTLVYDNSRNRNKNPLKILSILTKALELGELKLEKEKLGYLRLKHKED